MRIAIVDDNINEARQLRDILMHVPTDDNHIIEIFDNGESFLAAAPDASFELVFMDIYLREENGIDIIRNLQSASPRTDVVFVTSSDDHAVAAFSLNAVHYLIKPATQEQVMEALRRIRERNRPEESGSILTVCIGKNVYTLAQTDIQRVEADDHKTNILMENGSVYSTRLGFGRVEQELDGSFLTVNRGLSVNMRHITRWGAQDITMSDGRSFLINRRKRQQLRETYMTYKMEEMAVKQEAPQ